MPDTLLEQLFGARAEAHTMRTALRAGDKHWTYAELRRQIESCAHRLRALGVGPGDRVLFTLPNSPEFVIAFFAVTALGAVVVTVGDKSIGNGLSWNDVVSLISSRGKKIDTCELKALKKTKKGEAVRRKHTNLWSTPNNWSVGAAAPGKHKDAK